MIVEILYFFFCNQKTAYEMRISDWSSDVCSSDLAEAGAEIATRPFQLVTGREWKGSAFGGARGRTDVPKIVDWYMDGKINIDDLITHKLSLDQINDGFDLLKRGESIRSVVVRSAAHTSELPSLMRTSYSDFCLQQTNTTT